MLSLYRNQSRNPLALSVGDGDVVGGCGDAHIGPAVAELQVKGLKVYLGEDVGIHHQNLVPQVVHKAQGADGAQVFLLLHAFYAGAVLEMGNHLVGQVIDGYTDTADAVLFQAPDGVVDDGLAADLQQGLGSGLRKGTQALAHTAGHQYGVYGQDALLLLEVDDVFQPSVGIQHRDDVEEEKEDPGGAPSG